MHSSPVMEQIEGLPMLEAAQRTHNTRCTRKVYSPSFASGVGISVPGPYWYTALQGR